MRLGAFASFRVALLVLAMIAGAGKCEDNLKYHFKDNIPSGSRQLNLGVSYLMPGSEMLLLDGEILPPEFYRLDPILGRLELLDLFPGGKLEIRADLRPYRLARLRTLNPLKSWRDLAGREVRSEEKHPLVRTQDRSSADPASMRMMGSKSLVLRMGSGEDMAVEQSLRLSLQGQIADSTFVEAQLRDDDLPFQPEGNTERLEELDKVSLSVTGPAGRADLGDFVFETRHRELTPFQRDFQGLAATWSGERGEASVFLAQSRGIFTSEDFYGEEGLQGPYELLSALRRDGAVILAGSERVFLNGRPLTRGRDRDYVIDYDQGSVTFGAAWPVSASDRIRVDFRYSLEAWRRSAWGGGGATRVAGLRVDYLHFDESDDADNPLAFALDDERLAALENAGDDLTLAVTDGVSATPGQGHYVWVDSVSVELPGHFEWVDSLGDYELRFREMGAGLGDYRAAGIAEGGRRIYEWTGEGLGSFALGEELAAPQSFSIESLRLDWQRGSWRLSSEMALSSYDANSLSQKDDDDNEGVAIRFGLLGDWAGPLDRRAKLEMSAGRLEARFKHPGARRGRHEYRDWNLAARPQNADEDEATLNLSWGRLDEGGLLLGADALRFRGHYKGIREHLRASMPMGRVLLLTESSLLQSRDEILGDGSGLFANLGMRGPGGWLPDFSASRRSVTAQPADSLDSSRAPEQRASFDHDQVELRMHGGGTAAWELAWGEEEIRAGENRDRVSRLRASLGGFNLAGAKTSLSGHFRQRKGFLEKDQFLAEGRMVWLPQNQGWYGQGLYRLGSRQQRLRESRLVFVGFGAGDRNEEGVYLGEGEGEYRLVSLPAEESARTRNLEIEASLLREPASKGTWFSLLASETRLVLLEESRDASIGDLLLLRSSALRRDGSTLLGELSVQQELRYPLAKAWRVRYRGELVERHDERFVNGARRDRQIHHQLRLRRGGKSGEFSFILRNEFNERFDAAGGGGGSYRVLARGGEGEGSIRLGDRLGGGFRGGLKWQRDESRELAVRNLILEPRLSLSPIKLIRLEVSWEFTRSKYSEGDPNAGRPWFFDAEGWKRIFRIEGSAQAGSHLTFSALYEMREEEDRDRVQRMRLESRAFF
ncbi:hypothetical protein H8E52_07710 [bacterium]|nr:hypothetical protein [bacterium]